MFSENQSRQLYVLSNTAADVIAPAVIDDQTSPSITASTSNAGSIQFINPSGSDEGYFLYKGPSTDGLQRSDLIKKCNVISVSCTAASAMVHNNRRVVINFNKSVIATASLSSSNIVYTSTLSIGGDYILNVDIHNYIAMDYNTTLRKFGAVRLAVGTTVKDACQKIAESLAKNFSRESNALVQVGISANANGSSPVLYGSGSFSSTNAVSIVIEEVEQTNWKLGATPQEFVNFDAVPSTVYDATTQDDVQWGSYTVTTGGTQPNSKKVANMEYFYHKNRGDIYGNTNWPDNIDTEYMVNSSSTNGYSMVDIHYYTEGNSHNIGHSEKTITLVGDKTLLKKVIGSARVTGQTPADPTGLYALLENTSAVITTSTGW